MYVYTHKRLKITFEFAKKCLTRLRIAVHDRHNSAAQLCLRVLHSLDVPVRNSRRHLSAQSAGSAILGRDSMRRALLTESPDRYDFSRSLLGRTKSGDMRRESEPWNNADSQVA